MTLDFVRRLRTARFATTTALLILLLLTTVTGCGGDGGGSNLVQVRATIVNGAGLPVAGAVVTIDTAPATTVLTGADGLVIANIPPGDYTLAVDLNSVQVFTQMFSTAGGNPRNLGSLQITSTVFGTVTGGTGAPLAGAVVMIDSTPAFTLTTGADGLFSTELPEGNYDLTIRFQGFTVRQENFNVTLPNSVSFGALQVLSTVSGIIVDGLLAPVPGATVTIDSVPPFQMTVGADGAFSADVVPNTYQLRVNESGVELLQTGVMVAGTAPVSLGNIQVFVDLNGRVIDDEDNPVSGAMVTVDTTPPSTLTTGADGTFHFSIPIFNSQLSVRFNNVNVAQMLVMPTAGTGPLLLPDIVVSSSGDADGDGLSDALEAMGWNILVNEDGGNTPVMRHVTSNPGMIDTDGDMLDDSTEFALRTDPRLGDTDGDLLPDAEEVTLYRSQPANVDTDRDAVERDAFGALMGLPNPSLFDGQEIALSETSPTLDDTDGDGLNDRDEILGGGFNPRLADVPLIELEAVSDPLVVLNVTFQNSAMTELTNRELEREENSSSRSDRNTVSVGLESTQTIQTQGMGSLSFPKFGASIGVTSTFGLKETFGYEYSTNFTTSSVSEMQNEVTMRMANDTVTSYEDGTIATAIKVTNTSNLSILVQDMRFLVFRLTPTPTGGALTLIGTLFEDVVAPATPILGSPASNAPGFILGPGGDFTVAVRNSTLPWQPLLPFIQNPDGLLFEIGSFSLFQVDAQGNPTSNFNALTQTVQERTGLVVIDYGDGVIERFAVATSVERNPDGSSAGISMNEILTDVLGYTFNTQVGTVPAQMNPDGTIAPGNQGRNFLTGINSHAASTTDGSRFWTVYGDSELVDQGNLLVNFEDIRLETGDRITLAFFEDLDLDGLNSREETFFGTSDTNCDTDGDGLTDFMEVKIGWEVDFSGTLTPPPGGCPPSGVGTQFNYTAFSNPRFFDSDQDGLSDFAERGPGLDDPTIPLGGNAALGIPPCAPVVGIGTGTDPKKSDTDEDNIPDIGDACPLDNPPSNGGGLGLPTTGLEVYYTCSSQDVAPPGGGTGRTTPDFSGNGRDGSLESTYVDADYVEGTTPTDGVHNFLDRRNLPERAFFLGNRFPGGDDGYVRIGDTTTAPFNLGASFTLSMWIYRSATAFNANSHLVEQPEWIRLRLDNDFPAFEVPDPMNPGTPLLMFTATGGATPAGAWEHLALTASYDAIGDVTTLAFFRDGNPAGTTTFAGSLFDPAAFAEINVGARVQLDMMGMPLAPDRGFTGAIDDFRIYSRALNTVEIDSLAQE